jgi:hypothetical protein
VSAAFGDPRLPEWFWEKVEPEPNSGCWLWAAASQSSGYGHIRRKGKDYRSHRVAYEALVGPIPDGLQIDHLCRTRCCVNPSHLEPVTCRTNLLRGETVTAMNAAKIECLRGHILRLAPGDGGKRGRRCHECDSEFHNRKYADDPAYREEAKARARATYYRLKASA